MSYEAVRETVYEHASGNPTFTVSAVERWSISMIKRLAAEHPDDVEITYENQDGSVVAHVPFEWMRIVPKRRSGMSAEHKAASAARLAEYRAKRKAAQSGQN